MSSFYDDASLVVIPSGYKTSKIYAEKPTDGSGDLTFTRASGATRVGPDGLIEKVRTNLLTYSNDFSNAAWINDNSTETSGQAGYDGTNNAWLLTSTSAGGFIYQNTTISGLNTFSVYAKAGSQIGVTLYSAHVSQGRYFNLSTGALGGTFVGTPLDSKIESIGSGWYRCSITVSATATNNFRVYVSNGTANVTGNVLIQNAQLETGDIATAYIPTTTAAVSVGPVSNVPRLDYLNSSCPRLLLEPQRTNSITSSESTATGWTFTNSSSAINQTASPDGYVNADSIVPDATSGQHAINSANITASGSFTLSAFVKAGEYTKVAIRESANTGSYASFNLATGTKIEDNVSGASFIQSYGNGWYRIGVTGTFSGTIRLGINVLSNAYTTGNPSSGTTFFAGNGTDKLFCWGMQCELGATYATSYIPTLGTSVTRVADDASKTGISSLIGQTEGTLYAEFEIDSPNTNGFNRVLAVGDGTANNRIFIFAHDTEVFRFYVANGGAAQVDIISTTSILGGIHKVAFAYKANDFVAYVDGVQVGSDTSGTIPTCSNVYVGTHESGSTQPLEGGINQALLFKTRLTNAQLAELTTL